MNGFQYIDMVLDGAFYIENRYSEDNRGSFTKIFEKCTFEKDGKLFRVSESFVSESAKYVIRGLHFQTNNPQAKLVTVLKGKVWDVIVDLRPKSPTFKKWAAEVLSEDNRGSIYIPKGFAHGFASLEDGSLMLYQCDGDYDLQTDTGIRFDDPDLAIDWPFDLKKAVLSEKDLKLGSFNDYMKNVIR